MTAPDPVDPPARAFRFVPDGPDCLADADTADVSTIVARSGAKVVALGGRKLHSGRDPVLEARRHVEGLDVEGVRIAVLLGYGSGHVARALAERLPDVPIGAFEPHRGVLRVGLSHGPVPENVFVLPDELSLRYFLHQELSVHKKVLLVRWPASERMDPAPYAGAVRMVGEAVARAKVVQQTRRIRLDAWQESFYANLPRLPGSGTIGRLDHALAGRPAVVVAAGPSLDRNLHLLREVAGHATILAVNTAAGALDRAGIVPTALVSVESLDVSPQLGNLSFLGRVPAFLDMTGHPNLWRLPFARRIAMCSDSASVSMFAARVCPGIRISAGFCVANAAVALAVRLGAPEIVLVGSDLAYSAGRMYARGTFFEDIEVDEAGDTIGFRNTEAKAAIEASDPSQKLAFGRQRRPRFEVPAWGGEGVVPTTRDFVMFRDWYAWNGAKMRTWGISCINATEGGASIPNWTEVPLADVIRRWKAEGLTEAPDPRRRLLELSAEPATDFDTLRAALEREIRLLRRVAGKIQKGLSMLGGAPDADLRLSPGKARKLHRLLDRIRNGLAEATLASDPIHLPLDALLERGDYTTTDLLRTLEQPVTAQIEKLARLVQSLGVPDSSGAPPDGAARRAA